MGGVTGTPKAEYVTQLQLYAALYAETVDRWPASLELLPLDGPPIRIAFDPQTCLELLQDAVDLRARVNGVVAASQSAPGVAEMRLANPSPSNCNFCTYRPVCVAYCHARQTAPAHVEWPIDLWGTIEEMKALGNSLLSITLKCDAVDTSDVRVVGLNPSLARHPALSNLKQKDKVALFNLKRIGGASTYSEGRLTVIYKIEWIADSSTCG